MTYETWLNVIEELKSSSANIETLNKLKNTEINTNINDLIIPKLEEMIKLRFSNNINKIINELESIFNDKNYLDFAILNYKKETNFLLELATLKQLPIDKQNTLKDMIKSETEKVYDILIKEANKIDYTGVLSSIINNNRIKWSE